MSYSEIVEAVEQLSKKEIEDLKNQLDNMLDEKLKREEFQKLLLNGPVMTDEEYNEFLEDRKHFSKWRAKESF